MQLKLSKNKTTRIIIIITIIIAVILLSIIISKVTSPRYRIVRETVMAGENATIWLNYMPSVKTNPFEGDPPEYKVIITFSAEHVTVPNGEIIGYNWDFNDGSYGRREIVSHEYPNDQHEYHVNLTVTDDNNIEYYYLSVIRISHAM